MMSNKHLNITYAYHFISEAIIIFLIAAPILYLHYRWVPYWSYLLVAFILCAVFSLLARKTTSYFIYIVIGILLIPIFYFLNYPLIVNLTFTGLLIWRYINVRSRSMIDLNRENGYIILSIILATMGVIIVKDSEIVFYASTIIILLIFGNIFSHLAVINKRDRRQFDLKTTLYIIGPLMIGTIILIPFFQSGKFLLLKLWDSFRYLVYVLASNMGKVLQLFELMSDKLEPVEIEESMLAEDNEYYNELKSESVIELIAPYIFIIVGIIIVGLIVLFAIKASKKVFKPLPQMPATNLVSYTTLTDEESDDKNIFNSLRNRFKRPEHPIRRYVFEFEKKTMTHDYGRKPHETIEEWLKRIDIDTNLEIYQKVRYGKEEVTEQEAATLKAELRKIESSLRSN